MCEKERKSTVSVRETEDKNKYQCTCPYVRTNNQVHMRERERQEQIICTVFGEEKEKLDFGE